MTRRLVAMLSVCFVILSMTVLPSAGATATSPRAEPSCDCGGTIRAALWRNPNYADDLGFRQCPVNSRFNCRAIRYQDITTYKCTSCGKMYDQVISWPIEYEHDHSSGGRTSR